jgi:hemerythrin
MDKLNWTPEMSVGVNEFDEQHKRVIMMINRLIDAQHATTDPRTISDMLDRMSRYAQEHLKTEERLMAQYGYPLFKQHKAQHMTYIKKIVDFCTAAQIVNDSIEGGLLAYLREWWEHHIQNSDKAYATFFNSVGIR